MAQATGQRYEFGCRDPQGYFIDAGLSHMATHRQEFQTARAILPLRRPPRPALEEDARDHGKGFDVVNESWFVKQAMRAGEGGLVAWFGAFVFECLQQRRLLAANIAPWAIKNLKGKVIQKSPRLTLTQRLVQRLTLTGVF